MSVTVSEKCHVTLRAVLPKISLISSCKTVDEILRSNAVVMVVIIVRQWLT